MLTWLLLSLLILGFTFYVRAHFVDWTFNIPQAWTGGPRELRLGFSHDVIMHGSTGGAAGGAEVPYMERWILWLPYVGRRRICEDCATCWGEGCYQWFIGGFTIRVHKFWRSDDDSAPHDHPWWFVTFPFTTYQEKYWDTEKRHMRWRPVRRFRFHYRPAEHRHIAYMPPGRQDPFYTFVVSGGFERKWGFWPRPDKFVPWREWAKRADIAGDQS